MDSNNVLVKYANQINLFPMNYGVIMIHIFPAATPKRLLTSVEIYLQLIALIQ